MYKLEDEIKIQYKTMPESYKRTVSKCIDVKNLMGSEKNIFIIGSGSSHNSSIFLSMLLDLAGIITKPLQASLFNEMIDKSNYRDGLIIAFSQSGESRDVINAAVSARKKDFKIISITNGINNSLSRISDINISYSAGAELAVTATKSFTGSMMAAFGIYSCIIDDIINIDGISGDIINITDKAFKTNYDYDFKRAVFLGSGLFTVDALEGALKLRETAGIDSEGFPAMEYEHGYMETIDNDTLIVSIGIKPPEKIKKYTSRFIVIDPGLMTGLNDEIMRAITCIIPLQVLALKAALARGIDPDHPQKLSKVVK
ncbi:SIS domain-containing protein [Picrophilus oshimae]|uniref:Isomerizing glucosamine--fructose-6-phosphate aminotransferase n=1 Tax=Picrophilus torridus (strain ATCC 700027 / DSM 9790 / JCM 10055 / NBRC 100828 / KAW 2/3) TaxID=1122961 RepID=Q6L354_PICTO|nr:SIS domain-containing protein [Picrophilus oshimae]AAT42597.1 isomerizing glucosamine--fructose-6-phosphate aminotransferase [Picrophilus oshimae DSM 9789]